MKGDVAKLSSARMKRLSDERLAEIRSSPEGLEAALARLAAFGETLLECLIARVREELPDASENDHLRAATKELARAYVTMWDSANKEATVVRLYDRGQKFAPMLDEEIAIAESAAATKEPSR